MPRPNQPRTIASEINLARRIAREREARGWSYETLAKLVTEAGCSIAGSAIFKIEKSDPPRKVSVDELVAFSRVFDAEITDLLTPVELLDQARVHDLLKEMGAAEVQFVEAAGVIMQAYGEFLSMAATDPDLHEYAQNLRFADSGPYAASLASTGDTDSGQHDGQMWASERIPDWDSTEITDRFRDFYRSLIAEGNKIAQLTTGFADRADDGK